MNQVPVAVLTIGHSTRSTEDFISILMAHDIRVLADVRSYPASGRHPQFNQENLERSLADSGIEYYHLRELGGRRNPRPNSRNLALTNAGFRGYADYMETEEFREGIARLEAMARSKRTAIMCAESVWWRCHRSLISDYLKARGTEVIHILSATRTEPHRYTSAARVINGELSYRGLFDSTA